MENDHRIDFSKLLGFDVVGVELSAGVDFKDDTIGAKLGAKVGKPPSENPPERAETGK